MAAELKCRLNERLRPNFGVTNDYDSVNVLAIYWEDTDQDFRGEAYKVKDFFGQTMHYNVTEFAIPTQNSQAALTTELNRFLLPQRTSRALYIIHYGGHGDRDYNSAQDRRRQSVWAGYVVVIPPSFFDELRLTALLLYNIAKPKEAQCLDGPTFSQSLAMLVAMCSCFWTAAIAHKPREKEVMDELFQQMWNYWLPVQWECRPTESAHTHSQASFSRSCNVCCQKAVDGHLSPWPMRAY